MLGTCLCFPGEMEPSVLFTPAYVDYCSTSGQSNTLRRRYVLCYLLYVFLEICMSAYECCNLIHI